MFQCTKTNTQEQKMLLLLYSHLEYPLNAIQKKGGGPYLFVEYRNDCRAIVDIF